MEKYYINPNSSYWGSTVDSEEPPFPGALEVPSPPDTNAAQIWNSSGWDAYTPPVPVLTQLNNLYQTLDIATQLQFLPYVGGIFALLTQGQTEQAKSLLAAIPTTGEASVVQAQMLAVLNV